MPFIGFFLNSRIGQIIGIVILLSGSFFTWLAIHDHNLWNEATQKFNTMQQQVFQQKQEEFKQQTEVINDNAARIRAIINNKNNETQTALESIEKKAAEEVKPQTPPKKDDKPVSDDAAPYIKSIVKQLDAAYGEKKK
jgi:DNA-binding protein H-NS